MILFRNKNEKMTVWMKVHMVIFSCFIGMIGVIPGIDCNIERVDIG
ncbi:MAG: hypothetical protein PHE02_13115 [Lachnospiraceae bacterium]|nr:hypothetical protein [Lachnospiraceae bacterium]